MDSSRYETQQLKHLCWLLKSTPEELKLIASGIDSYYKERSEVKLNKETNTIKHYKDGTTKERTFRPSNGRLKDIQSIIKNKILASVIFPDNVYGGVKGKDNIWNAKKHQGNKFIFTTDLKDFYPTISNRQVFESFGKIGFSSTKAHWLTKLTTWKGQICQGPSTSTHIANIVFLQTDFILIEFCKTHGITYTRFIDDLTFSAQKDFAPLLNCLLRIIVTNNFQINYRKTRYSGYQTITGISIFNNYIDAIPKHKVLAAREVEQKLKVMPINNYVSRIRSTNNKSVTDKM